MWLTDEREPPRFVYMLSWPDLSTMRDGWERFKADEEWIEIKRQSEAADGELVRSVEDVVLEPVDFSAPLSAGTSKLS